MIWAWILGLAAIAVILFIVIRVTCNKSYVVARAKSQIRRVLGENKVMIIKNYNNEGGFFWQIYNLLNMLFLCDSYGFKPLVLFDTGLYFEKRSHMVRDMKVFDKNNWYNHFFEPLNESGQSQDFWVQYLRENRNIPVYKYREIPSPVMMFNRTTLKSIAKAPGRSQSYTKLWHKYIRVQPHILEKVAAFKKKHNFEEKHQIGMHFRGTDKFQSSSGHEDYPIHYEYDFCLKLLKDYLANYKGTKDIVLFIASDEQPFIEFIEDAGLPIKVTSTDSIRAGISTSGLLMDTSQCAKGKMQNEVCTRFNQLITDSVHRGFPETSKYIKGEDVLVDVLLLSGSDVFFRSRGNVSNFIGYINPKCEVRDMVNIYKKKKQM